MRKTDAPGSVSNAFVDYDEATSTPGTVVEADFLNDVQNELIGIQEDASIAEAAGTNHYVLAAIKYNIIRFSKQVGEIFHLDSHKAPAEFDKDSPESFFPAVNLSAIDGTVDIADANYPDLGPHLRAKKLTVSEGETGAKDQFDVTAWDITGGEFTLTFAGTDPETFALSALLEDKMVHGSYSSWRSIELPSAIGNLSAGVYAITVVDPLAGTVKGSTTDSDGSGSVTAVAEFPQHKVAGSSTTARLFEVKGRATVSANDSDGRYISGLRSRDQMQQITGSVEEYFKNSDPTASTGALESTEVGVSTARGASTLAYGTISFDSANSPNARTGTTTDPRALAVHTYMWAGRYTA